MKLLYLTIILYVLPEGILAGGPELQNGFSQLFTAPRSKGKSVADIASFAISKELQEKFKKVLDLVKVDEGFAMFRSTHRQGFVLLLEALRDAGDAGSILKAAEYFKSHPKMNQHLWINAVIAASIMNPELRDMGRPHVLSLMPDEFIYKEAIHESMTHMKSATPQACTVLDGSRGTDNGPENVLWYFREDLQANTQHWFWHLLQHVYLTSPSEKKFDRNGELFWYFHRNMLARYESERMANGFARTTPFKIATGVIIDEPYNPHLGGMTTVNTYLPRPAKMAFKEMESMTKAYDFLMADIKARRLIALNGTEIKLDGFTGADLIGDLLESSHKSVNRDRYTQEGLHNDGHDKIARLSPGQHGPATFGVMELPSTSMRDPAFYRWHKIIDNIVQEHLNLLPPHQPTKGDFPVLWPGVKVTNFRVTSNGVSVPNEMRTRMGKIWVEIPVFADAMIGNQTSEYCITRLEHNHFRYTFAVESVTNGKGTVRIFMAPKNNEKGAPIPLDEQRSLFFPMDTFTIDLKPGINKIIRQSKDSSLTLKWDLDDFNNKPPSEASPNCGCGHPSNMLVPRGTKTGMLFDLYIIVTDHANDNTGIPETKPTKCEMAPMICGSFDPPKYPDKKPAGYPFDRHFHTDAGKPVTTVKDFAGAIANSEAIQVKVVYENIGIN